jgi:YVTN family beta-propeller protein
MHAGSRKKAQRERLSSTGFMTATAEIFHMQPSHVLAAVVISAAALVLAIPTPVLAQSAPSYRVTKTVSLGAPDRWDYVVFDPSSQRVFIAHGDRVTVVDGHDGTLLGQVEGFPGGTHGIAISTATGKGYTDDGRTGVAGSFNLKTLKTGKTIRAAEDADGMVFDAATGHVFVVNGDSATLTVIDPQSDTAIATIDGGGKLEYAVADGDGKLYVNGAEKKEIVRIDTKTNQVDAHWSMPNCTSPHGLAMDATTHRLFSSCVNNVLVVVDTDSGATVATLPIGSGSDAAAFDPKRKLVFSSNGRDGTLSVIQEKDANTFVSLGDIKTAVTARTMAVDPATGRIYLAAGDIDPQAVAPNGRPRTVPGSLKLLFLDPAL